MRIKHNGLGFTGYTWDAVLGVWFAQARMYDASSKRFLSTDPIGGSVLKPELFNPYAYCADDPINNIDPTGMYMEGDEALGLSPEQTAAIAVCSDQWFAAQASGNKDGMDAAHAAADAIRNMTQTDLSRSAGMYSGNTAYIGLTAFPPSSMDILVSAMQKTQPALKLEQVRLTAKQWSETVKTIAPKIPGIPSQGTKSTSVVAGVFEGFLDMSKLPGMGINDLIKILPEGWSYELNNGRLHIRDPIHKFPRIRTDLPDSGTNYDHVHLYDENNNLIDKNGNPVKDNDPSGHQRFKRSDDDDDNPSGGTPSVPQTALAENKQQDSNSSNQIIDQIVGGVIVAVLVILGGVYSLKQSPPNTG